MDITHHSFDGDTSLDQFKDDPEASKYLQGYTGKQIVEDLDSLPIEQEF